MSFSELGTVLLATRTVSLPAPVWICTEVAVGVPATLTKLPPAAAVE